MDLPFLQHGLTLAVCLSAFVAENSFPSGDAPCVVVGAFVKRRGENIIAQLGKHLVAWVCGGYNSSTVRD